MSSGDVQGLFTEPLIFTNLKGWKQEAALLGFKSSPGAVRMRKAMHVRAYVYWCDCACGGLRQPLRESPLSVLFIYARFLSYDQSFQTWLVTSQLTLENPLAPPPKSWDYETRRL